MARPVGGAKRSLTRVQLIGLGILGIGTALLVAFLWHRSTSDDRPIRVKNGSMDIELCPGEAWGSDQTGYVAPRRGASQVWVTVTGATGCDLTPNKAAQVRLWYSDQRLPTGEYPSGERVLIMTGGKLRVQPKSVLENTPLTPHRLSHSAANDTGHFIGKIELVGAGSPPRHCVFETRDDLVRIDLCFSSETCTPCPE